MNNSDWDANRCFVPELLVDTISKSVRHQNKETLDPTSFFFEGVCLLVDISGFTKLSEEFCAQGKDGIDGLQTATNGYMGKLVEIIYSQGGDIIKFAGDAIVCVFSNHLVTELVKPKVVGQSTRTLRRSFQGSSLFEFSASSDSARFAFMREPSRKVTKAVSDLVDNFSRGSSQGISPEVVARAMYCAQTLREVRTDKLTVHVGISCGQLCFGILGGQDDQWECLMSGPCLELLSSCLDEAPSQQAVICPNCFRLIKEADMLLLTDSFDSVDLISLKFKSRWPGTNVI